MRNVLSLPFLAVLLSTSLLAAGSPTTQRSISVDVTQARGPRDAFWRACVGSERAGVMLRPENLQQLALVQKEIGFERIRFHGIFHDDMNVYHEVDGKPVYDFSKIDTLYDAFLKLGIRPFVELSFMPHDLASGTTTVFYWKGNVTPPKDHAKWASLIAAFARHLLDRYGAAEVENWNFEVWNEPNLRAFWNGTRANYFQLYDVTSKALKSVDAKLKVGGPATAGAATNSVIRSISFPPTPTAAIKSSTRQASGSRTCCTTLMQVSLPSGVPISRSYHLRSPRFRCTTPSGARRLPHAIPFMMIASAPLTSARSSSPAKACSAR